MPLVDLSPSAVADYGLYPQALSLKEAHLSEVFTLKWTRRSRRRSRLARLRRNHLAGLPATFSVKQRAREAVIAVVGPCAQDACCTTGAERDTRCHRLDQCGCKVRRHPIHPGETHSELSDLAATLHAQAVLNGRAEP